MFYTVKKISNYSMMVVIATLFLGAVQVAAEQNEQVIEPYELKQRLMQHKRKAELEQNLAGTLSLMPSRHNIDIAAFENYDEFVITITGKQGFTKQIKNTYGSLDIYDLDLPYDGKYTYEVLGIKYTNEEIKDVINNGRGENASTTMAISHKISGQFETVNGDVLVPKALEEPQPGILPKKNTKNSHIVSLLGGMQ